MPASLFASALAAAHRANRRLLGAASDPCGRPLLIFWPRDPSTSRRNEEQDYHVPPIRAFIGQGRRSATSIDGGLVVMPRDIVTFAAELKDFPAALQPVIGISFLAGPTREEVKRYLIQDVTRVAGLVEIQATLE